MGSVGNTGWGEEFSEIGEKGEIGFIDYEDDKSVCSYNPREEGAVIISVPFPFVKGKPQSIFIGETFKCSITIENTTSESVELWKTNIFCSNPADSFTLSLIEPPSANSSEEHILSFVEGFELDDRVLQPHTTLTIWLSCKPKDMGLHTSVVHFDVGDERVERVVFLLAEDKISQSLSSNNPYSRKPRRKQTHVDEYVLASRPGRPNGAKDFKNGPRLPQFQIAKETRELLQNKQVPDAITQGLARQNYATYFTALLNMEELHLEEEMRSYDMEHVELRRKGGVYLALEVPGLAEKRPSLVNGDFVIAKLASERSDGNVRPYQGFIHRVEADEVLLKFSHDFHASHQNGDFYDIGFTCNRVGMRRLYQAVQEAAKLETDLLFPSQTTTTRLITPTPVVPLTCNINEEQLHAVEMILGCKGAPPYVIFGPPGTGKTLTFVEAILQLYSAAKKGARILVCAASNSAADHILNKIIGNNVVEVKESEIFRLNAPSRGYDDVQPDHIRFCYFEDSVFQCPPLMALMRYRIIISTYMSTYLIHQEGIRRGHFSHLFLDEAGQASEPDTMVPIAHLCKRETVVVLAGDPMQLGPVVFSRDAESCGLGKSYLERLFECEFYHNEDDNYVVKLVRNYRCHPAILDLPSKLFYNGDLLACKEDDSSYIDLSFGFLPNKEFPVLFYGIQGCDEREGNNPSWFNRFEASKAVEIIKKLTKNSDSDCPDIGIITPYRKQVEKISKALENVCIEGVKVGSVEQFQGQEREVIIISTVRSTVKHNSFDKTYCLGFLSNPRRFNVAITRARSLLVIIGNPHIISEDPYWDKLLRYCADNNSYDGCPLPERKVSEEENFNPSSNDPESSNDWEWGQTSEGKVLGEENFNPSSNDPEPSNDWGWGQASEPEVPGLPERVTDESQWSDGWKL